MPTRSLSVIGLGVMVGAFALAACGGNSNGNLPTTGGEATTPGSAKLVAVEPAQLFLGRGGKLVIIGEGTDWKPGVTVNLGAGVTAGEVVVASPTRLEVPVTVPNDAALGPRDLRVGGGGAELALSAAYKVASPLVLERLKGTQAQGSVLFMSVKNLDPSTPFDVTTVEDETHGTLSFQNLEVIVPAGVTAQLDVYSGDATKFQVGLILQIDVSAKPGPLDLELRSGPAGKETTFRLPAAWNIAARPGIALAEGVPMNGTLAASSDSELYKFTVSERSIVRLTSTQRSKDGSAEIILLGPDGSFSEILGYTSKPGAITSDTLYAVVLDSFSTAGSEFQIAVQSAPIGTQTTTESAVLHATSATAQQVSLPITVTDAQLESDTAQDWYRVDVQPADANKALAIATFGPQLTNPDVELLAADGTTVVATTATSFSTTYHETFFTSGLPAGTYYVRIFTPSDAPGPGPYNVVLALGRAATSQQ